MINRFTVLAFLLGVLMGTPVFISAQDETPETGVNTGLTIHVVQRGENLYRIALRYATTVDEIVSINGLLDATRIDIGQRLLVPSLEAITPEPLTHTIKPGETLFTIAQLYEVPVETLQSLNEIVDPNAIYAGQVLTIRGVDTSEEPAVAPTDVPLLAQEDLPLIQSNIHVVRSGETLFRIASSYNLTTQELATANGITDPTVIYAGQQLIIPNLPESQLPAAILPEPITDLNIRPLSFVEGETGVMSIETGIRTAVTGTFLGRELNIITQNDGTSHLALIGIPVFTETGIYTITLTFDNADGSQQQFAFNVQVSSGFYGSQNLSVTDANLAQPAVQDAELTLLTSLTSAVTLERRWSGPFSIPAAAAMNSGFGTLRSYNGGPISTYHSGADFASAPGTPVYAAAGGVVVLADTLNIRGNTIVIDHGWGVYTTYAHLSTLSVALGETVITGQVIGTAGATGRVTGPHLHWEVWVNGVPVNPLTWTQEVFVS